MGIQGHAGVLLCKTLQQPREDAWKHDWGPCHAPIKTEDWKEDEDENPADIW